jgi:uncharacterized protein YjeT (DUF2065 family)
MKNYIPVLFCLLICTFSITSFAEEAKSPTTAADVVMQVEKDLSSSIERLAQKLEKVVETTAPVVWKSLVKQQIIMGASSLGMYGVFFVMLIVLIKWWKYIIKSIQTTTDTHLNVEDSMFPQITINSVLSVVLLFCFIGMFVNIGQSVAMVINPEYYAIQELVKMVK